MFEITSDSLTSCVKRVPIAKIADPTKPGDVRPIDLYSALMRVYASATYSILQPWARAVLNPCQFATTGGALSAVSSIALRTELALENMTPTLAIAVDFAKMFNMLSGEVAARVAQFMGLSQRMADTLHSPLRDSSFVWRLPFGALPKFMSHHREDYHKGWRLAYS